MAQDFITLLGKLHDNSLMNLTDTPSTDLVVDDKRKITPAPSFDSTIAYEGDINSRVIILQLPKTYARHDLTLCQNKELKWKNLSSGAEGVSTLKEETTVGSSMGLWEWEVPSEACTRAGNIEIFITFYDKDESDGTIAFAWNTASYSDLKVEKTMSSVSANYPARDEILLVDEEAHHIIAPVGYNNVVCNYGDKGVSEVYFAINRYFGKDSSLDIFADGTDVFIVVVMNELIGVDRENITKQLYSTELSGRKNEGMVLLTWKVPVGLTAGNGGPGTFKIALGIQDSTHRWCSNTYDKLEVGHSLFEYHPDGEPEEWGLTTDFVEKVLEDYFNNGMVVFDPDYQA